MGVIDVFSVTQSPKGEESIFQDTFDGERHSFLMHSFQVLCTYQALAFFEKKLTMNAQFNNLHILVIRA